jgi:hypothetical protein
MLTRVLLRLQSLTLRPACRFSMLSDYLTQKQVKKQ